MDPDDDVEYLLVRAAPPGAEIEPERAHVAPDPRSYAPGRYMVDSRVTAVHNIRAAAKSSAPIIGHLRGGDVVEVAEVLVDGDHVWAKLARSSSGPPFWMMVADGASQPFAQYLDATPAAAAAHTAAGRGALATAKIAAEAQAAPPKGSQVASALDRSLAQLLGTKPPAPGKKADGPPVASIDDFVEHVLAMGRGAAIAEQAQVKASQYEHTVMGMHAAANMGQAAHERKAKLLKAREVWDVSKSKIGMERGAALERLEHDLGLADERCGRRLQHLGHDAAAAAAPAEVALRHAALPVAQEPGPVPATAGAGAAERSPSAARAPGRAARLAPALLEAVQRADEDLGVGDPQLDRALAAMEALTAKCYLALGGDRQEERIVSA